MISKFLGAYLFHNILFMYFISSQTQMPASHLTTTYRGPVTVSWTAILRPVATINHRVLDRRPRTTHHWPVLKTSNPERTGLFLEFSVWSTSSRTTLTLAVEVAAVQQVAVCGPDVPVQRRVLRLQPRESNRRLVDEQLQPGASLAVVQDEEQVGGVRHDETGPETSTCDTWRDRDTVDVQFLTDTGSEQYVWITGGSETFTELLSN